MLHCSSAPFLSSLP
uniref:Uncharacterized protein n=1 Tax=Anguilla anguilla TaxID=7936 RepID=A0A0E9SAN0_ANGAN